MKEQIGGRAGEIYRHEDSVVRPLNTWSQTVHLLLNHFQLKGLIESPIFLGYQGENECLSFVEGETYNYPLSGPIASDEALISSAKLLKKMHDASVDFLSLHSSDDLHWMLEAREPKEVICHGDFTPYNVSLKGNKVVGVFDFDTAHPAPRVWDLAYSIYCWAPFKTDSIDRLGTLAQQIERARIFCDAYNATQQQREVLVETMIQRLQSLVLFMQSQAACGNEQFSQNIAQGHHLSYLNDIEYLRQYHFQITAQLLHNEIEK
ncbi:phosphotransferase [Vibrio rumoiensis]|uniref:Phosphotransferase n=1 Tax=Vibrio rumoiensis TaxID=76258 RepID=A0ABW7IZ25_9VIBR